MIYLIKKFSLISQSNYSVQKLDQYKSKTVFVNEKTILKKIKKTKWHQRKRLKRK
jgi:hypothetical protein